MTLNNKEYKVSMYSSPKWVFYKDWVAHKHPHRVKITNGQDTAYFTYKDNKKSVDEESIIDAVNCIISDADNARFSFNEFCQCYDFEGNKDDKRVYNDCISLDKRLERLGILFAERNDFFDRYY